MFSSLFCRQHNGQKGPEDNLVGLLELTQAPVPLVLGSEDNSDLDMITKNVNVLESVCSNLLHFALSVIKSSLLCDWQRKEQ